MYIAAFTSGLTFFRSRSHEQHVNEHIFCGPQIFDAFAMTRLLLKKPTNPGTPLDELRVV